MCTKDLYYIQKLPEQDHDKVVKPKSYALDSKVWLNNKYIEIKRNDKLEAKFFIPF